MRKIEFRLSTGAVHQIIRMLLFSHKKHPDNAVLNHQSWALGTAGHSLGYTAHKVAFDISVGAA